MRRGKRLVNAKGADGKVLYIDRDDKRIDDVWRLSMLQPADETEPMLYPKQKPKALLSLIVEDPRRRAIWSSTASPVPDAISTKGHVHGRAVSKKNPSNYATSRGPRVGSGCPARVAARARAMGPGAPGSNLRPRA